MAFIEKPYKNDELADAIRKALEGGTPAQHVPAEQAEERQRLAAQEPQTRFPRI